MTNQRREKVPNVIHEGITASFHKNEYDYYHDVDDNILEKNYNSTLIEFRNFVLQRYGIRPKRRRQRWQNKLQEEEEKEEGRRHNEHDKNNDDKENDNDKATLTLLARVDYYPHPRSDGMTDRIFANITDDVQYLQSLYNDNNNTNNYHINVVSFENMTFKQQLLHVTQTDLWVSVHGAGNIHVLFLPYHAQIMEYFPKGFIQRRRFKFLSECILTPYHQHHHDDYDDKYGNNTHSHNDDIVHYHAKPAWIVEKRQSKNKNNNNNGASTKKDKISVRLRPITQQEKDYQLSS